MGGRGASAGLRGGGGGGGGLGAMLGNAGQPQQPPQNQQQQSNGPKVPSNFGNQTKPAGEDLVAVYQPGYDNNGDPNVLKWQQQQNGDKAASYLSKVNNMYQFDETDPNRHSGNMIDSNGNKITDQYGFYDGEFQKFSLAMNLNAKPTILDEKTFDRMVQKNSLQVLYRGEAGQTQADRFMFADISHTGVGSYGDGYYFATESGTANDYANDKGGSSGRVMKMALSPTARAINYWDLQAKMRSDPSAKLQSALRIAGNSAPNANYKNSGEAQYALKLGYNVITMGNWCYAISRDAFIVCSKTEKPYVW